MHSVDPRKDANDGEIFLIPVLYYDTSVHVWEIESSSSWEMHDNIRAFIHSCMHPSTHLFSNKYALTIYNV